MLHNFWLIFYYFLQLMSVGSACKSAAKSIEKKISHSYVNYATLFLSWMPFRMVNKRNFLKNINLHFWLKISFDSIDHDVLNFRLGYVRRLVKRLKCGFYKSYFFSEWTSDQLEHFLNIFVITFRWVCCCCAVMTKMLKKCSTDQRFIRKRDTTYKIGTLVQEKENSKSYH